MNSEPQLQERPVFVPSNLKRNRPDSYSQFEMKRAVFDRDGLEKGCYWCGVPFPTFADSTLEHIIPLADGGPHELQNCALACEPCNLKNVPKCVKQAVQAKEKKKAENRVANCSGESAPNCLPYCDIAVFNRFDSIYRMMPAKFLDHAHAVAILKRIHSSLGLPPPIPKQKRVFRGHYNRWVTEYHGIVGEPKKKKLHA